MFWIIENKTFVAFVALAVIAIAAAYNFLIGPIQEATAELRNKQLKLSAGIELNVKNGVFLADKSIQNAEAELQFVNTKYLQLTNRINFKPLPGYELPEVKRPSDMIVNFQQLLKGVQKRLEEKSAAKSIPIPAKLDFPLTNVSADTLATYYEKLDIIEQLVDLAMDVNCEKITAFGVTGADFKDFRDVKETVTKSDLAIKNLVFIKLNGNFAAITQLINSIQKAERFISIEKTILDSPNPDVDNLNVTLVVAGVKLIPPKTITNKQ